MKISLIGCGNMGKNHARILRELGALDAIIETDEKRLEELEHLGYGSFLQSDIESTNSDGYVIATPSSTQYKILSSVLEKTNAVLLEKPALSSIQEYDLVAANFDTSKVCVGHIERFNPAVTKAKESYSKSTKRCEFYRYSQRPQQIADTGVWRDLGVHDVDLMVYLLGAPQNVISHGVLHNGVDVSFHANFSFINGVSASVNVSWLATVKRRSIHIYGKEGETTVDLLNQRIAHVSDHEMRLKPDNHFSPGVSSFTAVHDMARVEPLRNEILHFIRVIKGMEEPLVPLNHARLVENVLAKAYNSFQKGMRIDI